MGQGVEAPIERRVEVQGQQLELDTYRATTMTRGRRLRSRWSEHQGLRPVAAKLPGIGRHLEIDLQMTTPIGKRYAD